MRSLHLIATIFAIACNSDVRTNIRSTSESPDRITEISFHLEHSLRFPNHNVDITMDKRFDGVFIRVVSAPMSGHAGWDSTRVDTTYKIDETLFNRVLSSIRKISSKDLESAGIVGDDGISCEIRFGDPQNYISYVVWTPYYDSKKRKTEDFLHACEQFISAAKLDPKDIL